MRPTTTTLQKSIIFFMSVSLHWVCVNYFCFVTILYLIPSYVARGRIFFCTSSSYWLLESLQYFSEESGALLAHYEPEPGVPNSGVEPEQGGPREGGFRDAGTGILAAEFGDVVE